MKGKSEKLQQYSMCYFFYFFFLSGWEASHSEILCIIHSQFPAPPQETVREAKIKPGPAALDSGIIRFKKHCHEIFDPRFFLSIKLSYALN
jgi:hypothetical protein